MTSDPHGTDTERRIAAAFHALATTEVPASAPRPPQAPRPPAGTDRATRRRRLQIAGGGLLAVAAAVVIALVLGGEVDDARVRPTASAATNPGTTAATSAPTTPPASTSAPTTPTTPTTPVTPTTGTTPPAATLATVTPLFAEATRDTRSDVVTVPGGFEGADLADGTIRFWRWNGTAWAVDGSSSYPADARGDGATTYTATIRQSATLTGMQHASFLVYGDAFTGDSTGFVMVFTDGPDGWGAVKAGQDGDLHPSGAPVDPADQIGLMYDGGFAGGLLRTVDCDPPTDAPLGGCGADTQVVKLWRWDGTRFVLDH